jgi:hypothetical protein
MKLNQHEDVMKLVGESFAATEQQAKAWLNK